ncbi:hypothetical protein [Sandaracinus amylolyticus]|uniref:hypothetical protein n=1 Tax=Sandaracinus amylolyticus TaxID=927083 RepID=UPI001F2B37F5|nr:hypothetical protein [Sandaracinus amylolyticus]
MDGVEGTVITGIDRARTTTDARSLVFVGNVVSVPFVSGWHIASLMACRPLREFGGLVLSESELNTGRAHRCHGTSASFTSTRNAAFTRAPMEGSRAVVEFEARGYPLEDERVFVVGEPLDALPLAGDVNVDFGGTMRAGITGVGAWVDED